MFTRKRRRRVQSYRRGKNTLGNEVRDMHKILEATTTSGPKLTKEIFASVAHPVQRHTYMLVQLVVTLSNI